MKYLQILTILSLFILVSCGKEKKEDDPIFNSKDKTYKLVWEDDFNTDGAPNQLNWGNELGFVRGEEEQYYTNRPANVRIENGVLILEAKEEKIKNEKFTFENDSNWINNREYSKYSSASLITKNKISWKYGKIEVKAKIPKGRGMWPAIWMLGDNIKQVGWPTCGEIDIMEYVGYQPHKIHGTVHSKSYNHTIGTQKGKTFTLQNPYDDFHIYALEWTDKKIEITVDENKYFSFENEHKTKNEWPFDQKFFMILNVAVGGGWGGQQGIDNSIFPQRMEVDYVKVYQLRN